MKYNKKIKLTEYSPGAGWACKLSASDLAQVLGKLNIPNDNIKSSGFETFDDCSIYQINDKQSIIQTVDFFTPIVDDPYMFGQIAATNSLSDIYAMGGTPLFALNIVGFPSDKIDLSILSDILQGGIDKCNSVKVPDTCLISLHDPELIKGFTRLVGLKNGCLVIDSRIDDVKDSDLNWLYSD